MIDLPQRRPLEARRRLVRRRSRGARGSRRRPFTAVLAWLNRLLYGGAAGRWLRSRLQAQLEISRVEIRLGRAGPGIDGLSIAFISDIHAGTFALESDLCRLAERVAAQRPDLVCLGGDLIDFSAEESLLLRKPLALLDPPLGIFAVPGNHDYMADPSLGTWTAVLREAGVRILLNQGERVERDGDSLWLAGVDDHGEGEPDLESALDGARPDEPVLLLSHRPDFFFESGSAGVDLTLSGHTHGGQIAFRGRGLPLIRNTRLGYWRGWFCEDGAQLYVGRGTGVTQLPVRIGAAPEVPILRLRSVQPIGR